jgi:hypothetical protein
LTAKGIRRCISLAPPFSAGEVRHYSGVKNAESNPVVTGLAASMLNVSCDDILSPKDGAVEEIAAYHTIYG